MRAAILAAGLALLCGCAADVKKGSSSDIALPADTRANLVVNFRGDQKVTSSEDWGRFRTMWKKALATEAYPYGYKIIDQYGAPRATDAPALLLVIDVSKFRYVTTSMRYGLGLWSGNAWVMSSVSIRDGETGQEYGSRTYDTRSTAWEGIFSAMTDKQLAAISKEMISEIKTARALPPKPQPTAAEAISLPKEQRIKLLQQQNLPYDQYQLEYRRIMGE
ncbi:hypothetical protein [Pseudomonas sp. 2023EL-01195]|uniref:hypothetical protein n=1 Tax=Pseudomonas sp. 2023EL-01195 TaxID=3088134 RepID=UPI00296ADCD8|nr:hypothetical protein [Pseudomonas sp. 2023EL-01195]MDW3713482.1 hypothetical protein [Pseudomonas sp. 2023EL-01195]